MPYGHLIKTNYREFGYQYAQKELEDALRMVAVQGINNGYSQEAALPWGCHADYEHDIWPIIPRINLDGSAEIDSSWSNESKTIKQVNLWGIAISEGYLGKNIDGNQLVEVEVDREYSIKFTIDKEEQKIEVGTGFSIFYLDKKYLKNFFIDMIKREIIIQDEQPELYQQLIDEEDKEQKELIGQVEQFQLNF